MTLPKTVGAVPKNTTEEIRATLQEYMGRAVCDLRVFGKFAAAATYKPTPKGVTFSPLLLPDLIRLLSEAEANARSLGLMRDIDHDE